MLWAFFIGDNYMIYTLTTKTVNQSIEKLYYLKGIIAGLTNCNPLPLSLEPQIQEIITVFKNLRDCDQIIFDWELPDLDDRR